MKGHKKALIPYVAALQAQERPAVRKADVPVAKRKLSKSSTGRFWFSVYNFIWT